MSRNPIQGSMTVSSSVQKWWSKVRKEKFKKLERTKGWRRLAAPCSRILGIVKLLFETKKSCLAP